ncbi:Receptor homology region, transmembrane domain- and RING domain-containing protein 2 [Cardamine amara subsp. amara]|uniref:Receptor homology region, transmembrane domain-and RING domain-containing protein 2 n=1 Tax=Cardamine amara subsp. amara TaxID=228776 RepID=A0ABD1B1B6_CARAN
MGSGRSKSCRGSSLSSTAKEEDSDVVAQPLPPSSLSNGGGRRRRSMSLFCSLHSSCLASSSTSHDTDDDDVEKVCNGWMRKSHHGRSVSRRRIESRNQGDASDCYDKELRDDKKKSENDELELDDDCGIEEEEEEEASVSNVQMRNVSGSNSIQESSTPGRVFSHFKFIPGNISSRLSRASSSRSFNTSYPVSSSREEGVTSPLESAIRLESPRIPVIDNVVRDIDAMRFGEDGSLRSPRVVNVMDNTFAGILDRRHVVREPSIDRNVRFSRTLSVGRLRDRVLRRSSLSDFTFRPSPHQGEEDTDLFSTETTAAEDTPVTSTSILNRSASSIRRTLFGIQDHETPAPLVREGRYQGLLEHRSDFLERRRRIRSQVRALQRLGSRFENVTGHHDRACVLSGQDQTGRCTCRAVTNRGSTTASTDETNARASISRIVLLAEALFEVLDEIHQQSVVLSSQQPSVSSIGSVPAPNDVVDLLPIKLYTKSQSEDSSQCYICLVEYEEGDTIRTLPCHHEFHRTCVDKWLKEIHRVCPLCRGDICRHGPSAEQH